MLDYDTARFKSSQVAAAAGIEMNTFRAYFKRGHFKMIGETERLASTHGAAHFWSLRDAMGFAIAGELIRAGADAGAAFDAGMWGFAHIGSAVVDPPIAGAPPMRNPGELWDARTVGFTAMAFFPATGNVNVFPFRHQFDWEDVLLDPKTKERSASILLFLNDVERRVFDSLGLNQGAQA
ncbi:hypothetical protein [uncultured Sphingomonas sp.]|uniref:hypothetical protein n=1 Tax=uncultured Sphingomonas sp. TaxID=158754 RepID=UPI0025DC241F|nr:hypothetical protein [uncultured Sphingomonas sp.]